MTIRHMLAPILCLALWTPLAGAADWPCYLGINRDNTSTEKNLKLWSGDSPKVLWKKNVGTGHSCMSVVGKRLYTQAPAGYGAWRLKRARSSGAGRPPPRATKPRPRRQWPTDWSSP